MDDDWIILGATVVSIADKSQEGSSLDKQASLAFRRSNQDVVKKAEQSGIEVVIWYNDSVVKLSPSEAASLLASRFSLLAADSVGVAK
jgi:histidinol phosphatase-like enzyme